MFVIDIHMLVLFVVGCVEMSIIAYWTAVVSKAKVLTSGLLTVVNILIWYYVLQSVLENLSNILLILTYAAGCACGTTLTTFLSSEKGKTLLSSMQYGLSTRKHVK